MNLSVDGRVRRSIFVAFAAGFAALSATAQEAPVAASPAVELAPQATVDSVPVQALPVEKTVPGAEKKVVKLERVEVTGSKIRKVDSATSNPVFTLDRRAIEATGAATLGDLLQSIPSVTGAVTNTQVNNGGGDGAATINLRGLGDERTLILLDGTRVVTSDVNSLPANMIERIDVLKQGAAAIYGSDAIGGVVNFITRKRFKGLEVSGSYSMTSRSDGQLLNTGLTYGSSTEKSRVVVGLGYNRQQDIGAGDREYTKAPYGYYANELSENFGTSSRSPTGRYYVSGYKNAAGEPCSSVTRIEGQDGTQADDYRCFNNNFGPGATDRYNFQPDNLTLTPSARASVFGLGSLQLTDSIESYGKVFFNSTTSNYQLAAEPFDNATVFAIKGNPVVLSGDSEYNPFGADVSTYALRSPFSGKRVKDFNTDTYQATAGLKFPIIGNFQGDLAFTYGRILQASSSVGFLDFSIIQQQLGATTRDSDGNLRCATENGDIIPNCTPVNAFGTTGNNFGALKATTNEQTDSFLQQITLDANGDLLELPAGALSVAAGLEYRKLGLSFTPDQLGSQFRLSEANSEATDGSYDVKEFFSELNVPILDSMPLAKSLVLNAGVRVSDYSNFGTTTNAKYGLEYRPYSDLLIRATYTDVFRAPTTTDLFGGSAQNAPQYSDPCTGLTASALADPAVQRGCAGADLASYEDGGDGYQQNNTQATTTIESDPNLKPEQGWATDWGFVFSPSFYKPISIEFDYWRYKLEDAIDELSLQQSLDACFTYGILCENVQRSGADMIGKQPLANLGTFETSGMDLGVKFAFPKTNFGNFNFGVDLTYLDKYSYAVIQKGIELDNVSVAGQYDANTFGASFPRIRGLSYLYWNKGSLGASLSVRTVGEQYERGGVDAFEDPSAGADCSGGGPDVVTDNDGNSVRCVQRIDFVNYVDVSGSYTVKRYDLKLTLGINDLFDEGAPLVVNGGNGATDPQAYLAAGQSYFFKFNKKFD